MWIYTFAQNFFKTAYILFWGWWTIAAISIGILTGCIIYAYGMRIGPFKNIPQDPEEMCYKEC